jgi:hypothetical protein
MTNLIVGLIAHLRRAWVLLKTYLRRAWVLLKTYLRHAWVLLKASWKLFLMAVVLLSAAFSYLVDHAEPGDWVSNSFAPQYTQISETYEQMLNSGTELRASDIGFPEMITILSEELTGPMNSIASIKVQRDSILTLWSNGETGQTIILELTLSDGSSATLKPAPDLQPVIRRRLLDDVLGRKARLLLWISFIVTVIVELPGSLRHARATIDHARKTGW